MKPPLKRIIDSLYEGASGLSTSGGKTPPPGRWGAEGRGSPSRGGPKGRPGPEDGHQHRGGGHDQAREGEEEAERIGSGDVEEVADHQGSQGAPHAVAEVDYAVDGAEAPAPEVVGRGSCLRFSKYFKS